MIKDALSGAGLKCHEFDITPFPIDNPESLGAFIPTSITCYTTIREPWNKEKIQILRNAGYPVEVLWENYEAKKVSGSHIRELIRHKNTCWEAMVPSEALPHIYHSIRSNPSCWF